MSFSFHLYRAPAHTGPISEWERNLAEPIGSATEVHAALAQLFATLTWGLPVNGHTHGEAFDERRRAWFRIATYEVEPAVVSIISVGHQASPATISTIMDRFGLNFCCTDFGDFRNPHLSEEDWAPASG